MRRSLGLMSFSKVATAAEIGVRTGSITELVTAYLEFMEAFAAYWVQMTNGVLFLQMIPNQPASGGICILDSANRTFYQIMFEDGDTTLTPGEFDKLVKEYGLMRYACNPGLIHAAAQGAGAA